MSYARNKDGSLKAKYADGQAADASAQAMKQFTLYVGHSFDPGHW